MRHVLSLLLLIGLLVAAFFTETQRPAHAADVQRPDRPSEAADFRWRQRLSADGTIPPDALWKAKLQRDDLLARPLPLARAGITPGAWRWLGPGNVGGRLRAILVHPTQHNTMWAGSAGGGIWKTVDGGTVWRPLADFVPSLAVSCMALDPVNPDVLYAGTGESFFSAAGARGASLRGAGVFRSADGGGSWTRIATTNPEPGVPQPQWYFINRIAIHPTNPQTILVATDQGIWRTTDGGATAWSQRTAQRAADLRFHPTNGNLCVAGRDDGTALWSTDAGQTWAAAAGLPAAGGMRIELAYARSSPATVYASVARFAAGAWSTLGIFRSTDGGQTYVARNTTVNFLGNQGYYDNALWVDPTDPLRLVAGGIDLWRSADGGTTLTRISDWSRVPVPNDSVHADHHAIVSHPGFDGTTNRTVFFGNDGGIYRATDVRAVTTSSGWTPLNASLGVTQFYGAAVNRTTGVILGGTQDNWNVRHPGTGTTWSPLGLVIGPNTFYTGDGGVCAFDSGAPGTCFGEYVYLEISRSTDGGLTASPIWNVGPSPLGDAGSSLSPPRANFVAPFVLDPNDPDRLLAGGWSLWRCNDARAGAPPTWTAIKAPVAGNVPISAIAVAEGSSDTVWVGHNDGQIWRTLNGTAAMPVWVRMDTNPPGLPARWCSRIAIDRNDRNRVWVAFMGYAADNLWRSTDGGASWVRSTGGAGAALPSIPVSSVTLHRTQPGWVYAGTDLGVFSSTDDGAVWSTSGEGPANLPVSELVWRNDRTLLAVTFGRGVYSADAGPPVVASGRTSLVSVASGGQWGNGDSAFPSMSADGRFVAFQSNSGNFETPNGTPRFAYGAFLHDRQARTTIPVSVSEVGAPAVPFAEQCALSANARVVSFQSSASNFVPNDTNGVLDVFVRDLAAGKNERVSVSAAGQEGNGPSFTGRSVSADGRFVTVWSYATNLVPGDTNGFADDFVYDRANRTIERVSVSSAGAEADAQSNGNWSAISGDGGLVAFSSPATNLVMGDTNGVADVFVRNRGAGTTIRASTTATGVESDGESTVPAFSANGRFVAFQSAGTNLVPGDNNGSRDIFVKDLGTGAIDRVSVDSTGREGFGDSSFPSVSADGRHVAFASTAFLASGAGTQLQIYVRDRTAGTTMLASRNNRADVAFDFCAAPSISADGRMVTYYSRATNLVTPDLNGVTLDVFFHDVQPSITAVNAARIGTTVTLDLRAADDAGNVHVAVSSLGNAPGIPIDTRVLPLNPDVLFQFSLATPAMFQNFIGVLDGTGRAMAGIVLPNDPSLVGLRFYTAFVTLRAGAPSGVGAISLPLLLTVQP